MKNREGDVWVATTKGIDKFRELRVASYSRREGLSADRVDSVLTARDGSIWVGNGALDSIRGSNVASINRLNGLPGREVTSLLEDQAGLLWVGVDEKLFVVKQGRFIEIRKGDGHRMGVVEHIVEDPDGTIWLAPIGPSHLIHIKNYEVIEEVEVPNKQRPHALGPDPGGGVWVSFKGGDIAKYNAGNWQIIPLHRQVNTGTIAQFVKSSWWGDPRRVQYRFA